MDGVLVWSLDPTTTSAGNRAKQCGMADSVDVDYYVSIDLPWHTSSTMTVRVTSTLDQPATDEWFGFTDLLISPYIRTWPSVDTFSTVSKRGVRGMAEANRTHKTGLPQRLMSSSFL